MMSWFHQVVRVAAVFYRGRVREIGPSSTPVPDCQGGSWGDEAPHPNAWKEVTTMFRTRIARTAPRGKFRPELLSLEDRCTPTVNSLMVMGITPGLGGAGLLSIGGVLSDSHANDLANAGLTINYQVLDGQGSILDAGSLSASQALPHSSLLSFGKTIPVSVAPGNTETIVIQASDVDAMWGTLTARATVYVSATRGLNSLGMGASEHDGDVYSGSGQGRISMVQGADGSFSARGTGSIRLASSPNNNNLMNATGSGRFNVSYDAAGDVSLALSGGKATLNYGTYAGDATATGGFTTTLTGNLKVTRLADASITGSARGNIGLSATMGRSTAGTRNANPTTLSGRGCNVAINVKSDNQGHFRLGLTGRMRMRGDLNTNLTEILAG